MGRSKEFINHLNPFFKIIILTIITIIGSTDFFPFVSGILIISGFIAGSLFSSLSFKEILYSIRAFIIMSIGFMNIILLTRYLSNQDLELLRVLGLGLRIVLISVYSTIFVKTTDPVEFVLSLIKYFRVPARYGYSFLTAYRFLPTFKDEMEIIKHAYQVRGIKESRNPLVQVWNSKRYIVPMLATAVRKGIRLSIAMEIRAFGKYGTRTYYRNLNISKNETVAAAAYILYIAMVTLLLYLNGLTNFTLIYGLS